MTSGFKGSPAPQTSRRATLQARKSSWISRRHTVGGAQKVVTAQRSSTQQRLGVEGRLVDHEDRGAGVPGREEGAPGVLGPAGRGDVDVHVARLQAEPVHGRQRAHGVAAMAVPHQLRLGGGARGEIEQERIVGVGRTVRRKRLRKRWPLPRMAASRHASTLRRRRCESRFSPPRPANFAT